MQALQEVDLKVRENAARKLLQSLDTRTQEAVIEQSLKKLDQRGLKTVALRAIQNADRFTIDAVRRALPDSEPLRRNVVKSTDKASILAALNLASSLNEQPTIDHSEATTRVSQVKYTEDHPATTALFLM